jgi:hypothetical protein
MMVFFGLLNLRTSEPNSDYRSVTLHIRWRLWVTITFSRVSIMAELHFQPLGHTIYIVNDVTVRFSRPRSI